MVTARVMRSAVAERVRYAAVKSGRGRARQCTSQDTVLWTEACLVDPNPTAARGVTLAMFNLAIDSKPRGCHVVALKVDDVAPNGYAIDRRFAFDRMVESWRFSGQSHYGHVPA